MKNRTLLLWLGALGPLSSALHAQQAGSIRGVITDKDFGGPVIEATVTIIGRPETAKTADQGNYLLRELPPGGLLRAWGPPVERFSLQQKLSMMAAAVLYISCAQHSTPCVNQ